MNYNQFYNLSCYEEFEIQATLSGISKIDILREIGCKESRYYFFISNDGIFNWFDLNGNHIEDPGILKEIKEEHIPSSISKCIIPNSVTYIDYCTFIGCESLKKISIPNNVISIGSEAFYRCKSLTSITIPNNVTYIGVWVFNNCNSLKEVIFKGKTLDEVKRMKNYPWGIEDENVFKFS